MELKTEKEMNLQNGHFPTFPWELKSYSYGHWVGKGEIFDFWLKEEEGCVTILFECSDPEGKIPQLRYDDEAFDRLMNGCMNQYELFEIVKKASNLQDLLYVETNTARIIPSDISKAFRERNEGHTVYLFRKKEEDSPIIKEVYFTLI